MQTKTWMICFLFEEFLSFLRGQFQGHLSINLASIGFKWT